MFKNYLDDIKYCIKNFDVDVKNYKAYTPSQLGIVGDDTNRIYLKSDTFPSFLQLNFNENSKNCNLFIGENFIKASKSFISFHKSNQNCYIGENVELGSLRINITMHEDFVVVGNGVCVRPNNSRWMTGTNPGKEMNGIIIGDDCLIAGESLIRASDGHPLIDLLTQKQVNISHFPVIVEPYCWFGQRTTLLKNVRIGACSIVGFGAVAFKSCDKFSAIMGTDGTIKSIYGKLWLRNKFSKSKKIFEIYKKRFISGESDDNN